MQVQRLDAEVVPRRQHPLVDPVIQHERKHAVETAYAIVPVLLVHLQDDLGVRGRAETASARDQFVAQFDVVVDLAVEDDQRPLRLHRLLAGREIDDREAPVGHADGALDDLAITIGTAVHEGRAHALQRRAVDRSMVESDDAGKSAHGNALNARRKTLRNGAGRNLPGSYDRATGRSRSGKAWVFCFFHVSGGNRTQRIGIAPGDGELAAHPMNSGLCESNLSVPEQLDTTHRVG